MVHGRMAKGLGVAIEDARSTVDRYGFGYRAVVNNKLCELRANVRSVVGMLRIQLSTMDFSSSWWMLDRPLIAADLVIDGTRSGEPLQEESHREGSFRGSIAIARVD